MIRIMGKLWKAWAKVLEIAKVTFESRDKTLLEFSDMRVMEREILCARRLLTQCQDTAFLLAHELPSVPISVISRKKKKPASPRKYSETWWSSQNTCSEGCVDFLLTREEFGALLEPAKNHD